MSMALGRSRVHSVWNTAVKVPVQQFLARKQCLSSSSVSLQQARRSTVDDVKDMIEMPGPKPLPVLGNLVPLYKNQTRMRLYLDELLDEYGSVAKLQIPGVGAVVVVADPDVVEEVLRAEGKYPMRDTSFSPKLRWFFDQAGFTQSFATSEGKEWRDGRVKYSKPVQPAMVNRYIDGLNSVYFKLTQYINNVRDSNQLIDDYADISRKVAMEATGKFLFDANLNLLADSNEEDEKLLEHVDNFFAGIGQLISEPQTYKIFPTKFKKFFIGSIQGTFRHGKMYAKEILKKVESEGDSDEVQSMLEQWLRQKNMSTDEAVAMSAGILAAGIHTTASQSNFLLYHMGQFPEVQEKLYQEIQSVLGSRPPTAQDLESIPYMRGCLMESFRFLSTISFLSRVLAEDAVIHGYHVPAGVNLWYSAVTASKDNKVFSEPSKFLPERWDRQKGRTHHPFALLPFGFGPRVCFGKRFAELELKLLLIEVVRNFKVETAGELSLVEKTVVTVDGKIPLYFKDRVN